MSTGAVRKKRASLRRAIDYYVITEPERDCYTLKNTREGRFSEHNNVLDSRGENAA